MSSCRKIFVQYTKLGLKISLRNQFNHLADALRIGLLVIVSIRYFADLYDKFEINYFHV